MNAWENIDSWELVLPPSRPSSFHLDIVRNSLAAVNKEAPVAVLGSTPELRDLLYREGFREISILDKYFDVYRRLSQMRSYSNDERLVVGDWIETLGQTTKFYAVILSDLTSGNVPYELRPIFYRLISDSLAPDGIFIDKVLTLEGERKKLDTLEDKYVNLPVNLLTANYFSCEFLFTSELLNISYSVDSTLFYEILKERLPSEHFRSLLRLCTYITPYNCVWHYGKPWEQLRHDYFRYLNLVREIDEEQSSPFAGNLKIIISRPFSSQVETQNH